MVGKRGRPLMRRTTSMSGITVDLMSNGEREPSDHGTTKLLIVDEIKANNNGLYAHDHHDNQHVSSSRYHHRSTSEGLQIETAHFLRTCGLCNRRLAPSRDIYMYRGDTAFCSMECREQQMKNDERKEKSKLILQKKTENHHNYSELPSANSENSSKSKTIAAA
ncbi:FCS-Like Zinc finger 5-like [Lycium barbarum]|uniref:FCS-Like Zinc finger 5-like n=1 Tax=Lycium barbarum TaxID=112863 RepID=UPI00293E4E1F|nr:FCS-Like Zinc finger 5-like [Lycium barbarum]